jgi:hypothetical protein
VYCATLNAALYGGARRRTSSQRTATACATSAKPSGATMTSAMPKVLEIDTSSLSVSPRATTIGRSSPKHEDHEEQQVRRRGRA